MSTNERSEAEERAKRLRAAMYDRPPWEELGQTLKDMWLGIEAKARDLYEDPLRARIAELEKAKQDSDEWVENRVAEVDKLNTRVSELEAQLEDARDVATANARLLKSWSSGEKNKPLADVMREFGMDPTPEHVSPAVRVEEQKRVPQVGDRIEANSSVFDWVTGVVVERDGNFFIVKADNHDWLGSYYDSSTDKWRWPATEEKPVEAPQPASDVTAKYEPSDEEWAGVGCSLVGTALYRNNVRALLARAESAERARYAAEIAKLRASNEALAKENGRLRGECEALREEAKATRVAMLRVAEIACEWNGGKEQGT